MPMGLEVIESLLTLSRQMSGGIVFTACQKIISVIGDWEQGTR